MITNIIYNKDCMNGMRFKYTNNRLGGDLIEIINGKVYVNGVQEMYIKGCSTYSYNFEYWDIPEGYVLGDNREDSLDSRYFGCVPVEALDGKVRYKYYADKKKLGKVY